MQWQLYLKICWRTLNCRNVPAVYVTGRYARTSWQMIANGTVFCCLLYAAALQIYIWRIMIHCGPGRIIVAEPENERTMALMNMHGSMVSFVISEGLSVS